MTGVPGGEGIEELTVICTSLQEKSKWITALKPHVKAMLASAVVKPQHLQVELECGPMPNVMVALPNIDGALCSTPQFV